MGKSKLPSFTWPGVSCKEVVEKCILDVSPRILGQETCMYWIESEGGMCVFVFFSKCVWSLISYVKLMSHASKVMLKILQARLQQYVNCEHSDVQAGFRKGRGTRLQIANICWIIKKQESSRKISISALLTMSKPLNVQITINCGKFWKRWEYQTTWPTSWETYMQVRKQQLELDMEQQTGSK